MKLKDSCSLEEKQWPTLQHIKKQRHYFVNKGLFSQGYGFPVVMYGCESWTIKRAEHQRIDGFELLEKTLESPLDCEEIQPVHPKGDQSWVFIGRTDAEVEYFDHLMRRADSFEKILILGKIEGRRRRGQQRMRWWMASPTRWTWVWLNSGSWWWTGRPGVLQSMGSQRVRQNWATELNWTVTMLHSHQQ